MSTADWNTLHGRFYRKSELYGMEWDGLELDREIVVAAPYGGPVAVKSDEQRNAARVQGWDDRLMRVFTSSGRLISSFTWPHKGLVRMGWTSKENLVAVLRDGNVHIYSLHGDLVSSFTMGPECAEDGIADCIIWSTGLVCRSAAKSRLFAVTDFDSPRCVQYCNPGLTSPPTCMDVVQPQLSSRGDGDVEILLATRTGDGEGGVMCVHRKDVQDHKLTQGPFSHIAVSPDGQRVACFNDEGTLFVFTSTFSKILSKFATQAKVSPRAVVWCGDDSVVLYWPKILLMVSPFGDFVKYTYDCNTVVFVTECDGLRILTSETCEFLARVPESVTNIFKVGSTTPAAFLYDASVAFDQRSAKADDNVRAIKTDADLETAVDQCLDASLQEFDHDTQTKLLKAAAYGMLFCESYSADKFVDTCRTLRVLNAVRDHHVGMPLTYMQYLHLDAEVTIDRVTHRHHHLLAIRMCEYLRIEPKRVLVHWACTKIQAASSVKDDDETLAKQILSKLQLYPNISYATIATVAYEASRTELATLLLEQEPKALDQVQLLLVMNEDELALSKACLSLDTDLIILAVLHIKQHHDQAEFFQMLKRYPLSINVYISYCKDSAAALSILSSQSAFSSSASSASTHSADLKQLYYHLQRPVDAANLGVTDAYQSRQWKERMQGLQVAQQFYTNANEQVNPFAKKMTEEQVALLKYQKKKEADLGDPTLVDLSVSQMLEKLLASGQVKEALALKNEFQVPDLRFWYLHVETLAKHRQWGELERLSKGRPPIGFEPFVEACIAAGNATEEAKKYIVKLTDPREQMESFCTIGLWKEALDVAVRERDAGALDVIAARCKIPAIQSLIVQARQSMGSH